MKRMAVRMSKKNKDFELCCYCGDQFFAADGRQTQESFLCRVCQSKGIKC